MGYNHHGTIAACYTAVSVSGSFWTIGGLVGINHSGTITACYATGSVTGERFIGGLVGDNFLGTITACYAIGSVSGTQDVGGLVASNWGTITSCFWDIQTTGQSGSGGGKDLTTAQMKTRSIYQNAGWANKGWVMTDGTDYPRLSWENTSGMPIPKAVIPFAGNGTAESPYLISTAQEFALLSWYSDVLDKHIRLTTNLDLSGVTVYCFGNMGKVRGVFDGNYYTISNLTVDAKSTSIVGLFGEIGSGGTVKNLKLENAIITATVPLRFGCVCGYNRGTIQNCGVNVTINNPPQNGSDFGGLVGYNYGTIRNCYSEGFILGGGGWAGMIGYGGLVGCNYMGTISGSYSTCSLDMTTCENVGGLVGYNYAGTITNCYATGTVNSSDDAVGGLVGYNNLGAITSCFWDMQTSGRTTSDGGTGKTTAEMKRLSTFIDSGWDYSDTEGDPADWQMPTNYYPHLAWEVIKCVDMEDLAILSSHWGMTGCDETQLCGDADWFVDGTIDILDLIQLAKSWLGIEIETDAPFIQDDFETGNFSSLNWQQGGNLAWTIVSDAIYEGSYAARSGEIFNSQTSSMSFTADTTGFTVLRFAYKVSSENGYDYLRFYIDGVQQNKWSGIRDWSVVEFPVSTGMHTFEWRYTKDNIYSSGFDCAWVDNIRIE
ncbi:MAG: GLUG motif-containing protein [Phycisphaerales bacterium]